jgi:hypothetical protein
VEQFIIDIHEQGEEWNTLKLVVLGHGEVGKTTLLHAIRRHFNSWVARVSFLFYIFFSILLCTISPNIYIASTQYKRANTEN